VRISQDAIALRLSLKLWRWQVFTRAVGAKPEKRQWKGECGILITIYLWHDLRERKIPA
jgi:hypothetical protein